MIDQCDFRLLGLSFAGILSLLSFVGYAYCAGISRLWELSMDWLIRGDRNLRFNTNTTKTMHEMFVIMLIITIDSEEAILLYHLLFSYYLLPNYEECLV